MMAPIFDQLSRKFGSLTFVKVDVDALQSVAAAAGVTGMPTFVGYAGGREAGRLTGADPGGLETLCSNLARIAKPTSFAGTGRTLGGGGTTSAAPAAASASASAGAAAAATAIDAPGLEDAAPTCLVTIRLQGDGKKVVGRFNPARHTVADVASFATAHGASRGGTLVAGFPPASLEDGAATLATAGLVNTVVTWRP
jgi:thioredoxin-like negative regulator of GroEL